MWIAHFSDLHLRPDGEKAYDLIDTNARAEQAITYLKTFAHPPEAVVVTGDISDRGERGGYEFAADLLGRLDLPVILLPGNHDDLGAMIDVFGPDLTLGPAPGPSVRIFALNSQIVGSGDGRLTADELLRLEAWLTIQEGPALVCLHHPPGMPGSGAMVEGAVEGEQELARIIAYHSCVKGVLAGHVHRSQVRIWAGVPLWIAPSTGYSKMAPPAFPAEGLCTQEPPAFLSHSFDDGQNLISQLMIADGDHAPLRLRSGKVLPL